MVALVWSADPELVGQIDATEALLCQTAFPLAVQQDSAWLLPALYGVGSAAPVLGFGILLLLGRELAGRDMSKGTIRFPLDEKVPVGLIRRIVKLRAKEVQARAAAPKAPARRPAR